MSDRRLGQVITFYSYKGGVGRSMALANVATLLAQRGKRVLVLDFDFEAPGLHRYFLGAPPDSALGQRLEQAGPRPGVIEFFTTLRKRLDARLPDSGSVAGGPGGLSEEQIQATLVEIVRELLDSEEFGYTVRLFNPNVPASGPGEQRVAKLSFLPTGRTIEGQLDVGYVDRVRGFNWGDFYEKYAEVFPVLAEEWGRRYDYVLIDSRTGITDVGSICTMMLPEKLVLAFSPNRQSLMGALEVGRQAVEQRKASADLRPLPLFPLISRMEDNEEMLKREWIGRAQDEFQRIFRELYGLDSCDLGHYFELARIPHRGFYSYGERIAAEEEPIVRTGALVQAFNQFIECLELDNPNKAMASPILNTTNRAKHTYNSWDMAIKYGDAAVVLGSANKRYAATFREKILRLLSIYNANFDKSGLIKNPAGGLYVRTKVNIQDEYLNPHEALELNAVGGSLLQEAKRRWKALGRVSADELFGLAKQRIATARAHAPEDPYVLINAGYIAFLEGRRDEARSLLNQAIQQGGEGLRKVGLECSEIHPLPEDEEFRAFIRSL